MGKVLIVPSKLEATTPKELSYATLNNNFDNVVQDIGNFGPTGAFAGSLTNFAIAGGSQQVFGLQYFDIPGTPDIAMLLTGVTIYVDSFDSAHLYPDGGSLTSGQKAMILSLVIPKTLPADRDFSDPLFGLTTTTWLVARAYLTIRNADSASHNYWATVTASALNPPITNVFR